MRPSKNKVIVLVLGVLVSFMALEVSLRIVGVAYSYRVREGHIAKREPGAFTILCVGDSFTFGTGAPRGKGYPSQLKQIRLSRTYILRSGI